ncbi:uncharacterized protein LOC144824370 [Lissotriton helveticus]
MAEPALVDCAKKVLAKIKEYCSEKDDNGDPCMTKAKLKEMVQNEFGLMMKDPNNAEAVKKLSKLAEDVKDSNLTIPDLCGFFGKLLIEMSKGPKDSSPVKTVLPSCGWKIITTFNEYCTETDDKGQHYMSKEKLQELVKEQFGDTIKNSKDPERAKALMKKVDEIKESKITLEGMCPMYVIILIDLSHSLK